MAVQIRISTEGKDEALDALLANTDGGKLKIYTGSGPASPDDVATGTLLATLTLSNPAFLAASGGSATADTVADALASATGTAGWARLTKSDNTTGVVDISVGGSFVYTVNTVSNVITCNVVHSLANATPIEVFYEVGGSLPAELSANTTFYVINASGADLQLEASIGGGAIDFSTAGSGTQRLKLASSGIALASADSSLSAGTTVSVASFIVSIP